jgi:glycosyltransferase involved in cell wall biosynthesis
MEILVKNKQLRTELGKRGRQRAKELYDWQKNLDAMLRIYEELPAGKTR